MPTLTIYQKPTCSTCRNVMERLRDAGVEYDSINYIIEPPSREKLAELVRKSGGSARALLRAKEPAARELGLTDPAVDDETLIDAMAANPALIERPILEYGDHAGLARPAERVTSLLEEWNIR